MKPKTGELKASPQKIIYGRKSDSFYISLTELIYCSGQGKLQKTTKAINYYKDKMGRNQKGNKKAKIQRAAGIQQS